ncbi:MAG: Clp protease N-terminal domain-containing protein, partial [Caldimonas sp.]
MFQPRSRDGDADHAQDPPRRPWRVRRLLEGRGRDQGRTGACRSAPRRPPAAMHYGVSMIAQELEVSLHMAFVEARQQRHEFITVEHLLMALLDNPSAAEVLRACSANLDDLRKSLLGFIKENTPTVGGA